MKISGDGPRVSGPVGVRKQEATKTAAALAAPIDSAAVVADLGIPPAELTPKVRAALVKLIEEVNALRRELAADQARIEELERLADTDTLSPVANRRAFVRELSRVMNYAERHAVEVSLLFFDVDGLKKINDAHGHAGGDAALRHVAETLRANVRASDIVGRLGGDEFGVILLKASEDQARVKARQLTAAIAETEFRAGSAPLTVSASVGAYTMAAGETPEQLLERADAKMYAAKAARTAEHA